jgi:hypothetical protein
VRVARSDRRGPPRAVRLAVRPEIPAAPQGAPGGPSERRRNVAATRRAVRLASLYAVGIAAVYAALVVAARAGPPAGSAGSTGALTVVGGVAVLMIGVGVVVALGAAPRYVELDERETVVVGRFGRRYRFPGRERLKPVVLRRFPAGWLSPIALESVEIGGGTTRRSFLLDEGLLGPGAGEPTVPAA